MHYHRATLALLFYQRNEAESRIFFFLKAIFGNFVENENAVSKRSYYPPSGFKLFFPFMRDKIPHRGFTQIHPVR